MNLLRTLALTLLFTLLMSCGSGPSSPSFTQTALIYDPDPAPIAANQCNSTLQLTNRFARIVTLHVMTHQLTAGSAQTTIHTSGADLRDIFGELVIGTGATTEVLITFDLSDYDDPTSVEINTVITAIDSYGFVVTFVGSLTCQ